MKRPENYFRGSLKDARRIIREILSALKYLCDQEIMHNDIKPANILYDRKVKGAVLIDFGLASLGGTVRTGGTPWYVPPELIEKGERGFKGDVFALGVTALYLLGKCPLPELQSQGWKIANVEGSTEDTTKMRKWLRKVKKMQDGLSNSKLEQVVKAMLTREPLNRISAGKALDKLKE